MVLFSAPVGETDRRVVLLTKEQGRISAFARGACRPKSPLLAASRPFASGEFVLIPRKDSYSLYSASIREYFDALTQDFEGMAYGCFFMEEAGYFASENVE
jgi:DNA repair protein RecO (recombination protein O)